MAARPVVEKVILLGIAGKGPGFFLGDFRPGIQAAIAQSAERSIAYLPLFNMMLPQGLVQRI